MPVLVLIEASIMYIIFANICKIRFKKIEIALTILAMSVSIFLAFALIPFMPIASLAGNAFCTIIMVLATYRKTKAFSISVFYAIFANIIALLSASVSSAASDFVFGGLYEYFERTLVLDAWVFYIPHAAMMFGIAFALSRFVGKMYHTKVAQLDDSTKKFIGKFLAVSSGITLCVAQNQAVPCFPSPKPQRKMGLILSDTSLSFWKNFQA